MMPHSPWRIDGHVARLESGPLRAEIDLANPAAGVRLLGVADAAIANLAIFQVGLPPLGPSSLPSAADFFSRGNDLVATYAERPEHPFRAQIYWRLLPESSLATIGRPARQHAGLEVIVSIQTSLLDSDPALTVATTIAAERASQLVDLDGTRLVELPAISNGPPLKTTGGTGCFVVPIHGSRLVYAEMIHPADFHLSTLERAATDPNAIHLAHRLFVQRLEKGVILRSRIRSLFAPVGMDLASIAGAYQDFAKSEPPLTA